MPLTFFVVLPLIHLIVVDFKTFGVGVGTAGAAVVGVGVGTAVGVGVGVGVDALKFP